jgi:hypothetical protein
MKRYVCTVAAGLLLALAGTATASANSGLPVLGQSATQQSILGDQSVEKQENDADVTQEQGNGNVNIAPAISVFGDAETKNEQGNGNYAESDIEQKNDVDQSQSSSQEQKLAGDGDGCCKTGQSQAGEQKTSFGDQTVGKQENDADVTQSQGNENVSYAPAHTSEGKEPSCSSECGKSRYPSHGQRGGDAETKNVQGNGNVAKSDVGQKNDVDQSQSSTQKQELSGKGGGCCKPRHDDSNSCDRKKDDDKRSYDSKRGKSDHGDTRSDDGDDRKCEWKKDDDDRKPEDCRSPKTDHGRQPSYDRPHECEPKWDHGCDHGCKPARGQAGEQHASFGDQTVEKQENDADVTQSQGNENVSYAPARTSDGKSQQPSYGTRGGDAETKNAQGNGNYAVSDVDQRNTVDQSQVSDLEQALVQGLVGQ